MHHILFVFPLRSIFMYVNDSPKNKIECNFLFMFKIYFFNLESEQLNFSNLKQLKFGGLKGIIKSRTRKLT